MTGGSPLDVAFSLARHGIHVFPVSRRKVPLVKGWQADASTDPEQIATWFTVDFPDALVGYACGLSGLVVVDLDRDKPFPEQHPRAGEQKGAGVDNLDAAGIVPPPTFTYQTAGGGTHLVYRAPRGRELTIAADTPVDGVDIRAGNGFAIYYGKPLKTAPTFAPAPEWALVEAKAKGSARAPSATLDAWLAAVPSGKPSKAVRKAAARIDSTSTDHETMLSAVGELVKLGTGGERGAGAALLEARERYVTGWDDDYGRRFDAAADGSVKHHGLPPVTFPLSKAERKALAKRTAETPTKSRKPQAAERYVDVAAFLSGDYQPPTPCAGGVLPDLSRTLYLAKIHSIVGESGIGKTLAALAMIVDELRNGGRALLMDCDFNGLDALHRLVSMTLGYGLDPAILADTSRFRLAMVESADAYRAIIADLGEWSPTLAVLDSESQIVPMFGGDSNSADDYARVNREAFAPFAAAGAAVLTIDHVAKTARDSGYASGTGSKRAVRDGVIYSAKSLEPFRPNEGGALALKVSKDRFAGVLAVMPGGGVVFRLDTRGPGWTWNFHPIRVGDEHAADQGAADVAFVLALEPFPTSKERLVAAVRDATGKGWGNERAHAALTAARERRQTTFPLEPPQ